jgi:hypothetical protein
VVVPTPPSDPVWGAAGAGLAASAAAGGAPVDFAAIAQQWGVAVMDMIRAMEALDPVARQLGRQTAQLEARAGFAQTAAGQAQFAQAAAARGQLAEAQARAAGQPTRAEAQAARAAEREDREAAGARRFAARIAEQEEAKAAKAQQRQEAQAQRQEAREARQTEAAEALARRNAAIGLGALAASGIAGRYGGLLGGAAGVAAGIGMGGLGGAATGVAAGFRGLQAKQEADVEAAAAANPMLGATVEASRRYAQAARGALPEVQGAARAEAVFQQAEARMNRGEMGMGEFFRAGSAALRGGEAPDWFKQEGVLPLPSEEITDPRQIWMRASTAGAQGGQISADTLRIQLEQMQKQGGLLEDIRDNNLDAIGQRWRR